MQDALMKDFCDIVRKEIEERAYDRWEFRQEYNIPGTAEEDWLAAEKEIMLWYKPETHIDQFNKMWWIGEEVK